MRHQRHWWKSQSPHRWILLILVSTFCGAGCQATVPYKYGHFRSSNHESSTEIVFEYGQPQKTLDRIAYVTGIWSRVLSLNSRVNKHDVSEETREKLIAYLEDNELNDVLVRVNQYDPKGEWRRLRSNDHVGPGWKYTFGVLSMVHYTLLPGRVFGGDEYNPYTNSLYLNSDVSAVVLHEAAYAKDVRSRFLPGTYVAINEIPGLSLWRHSVGVSDVLGYALLNDDWTIERETYRVVYPQLGVHGAALAGSFVPFWDGLLFTVAGAAAGHTTGRIAIARRVAERQRLLNIRDDIDSNSDDEELAKDDQTNDGIQFTSHREESSMDRQKIDLAN